MAVAPLSSRASVTIVAFTSIVVALPFGFLLYQSVLSQPFFEPTASLSVSAFQEILTDADFWHALRNTLLLAIAKVIIAVPLGSAVAILVTRTNVPFARALDNLMMLPMLVPAIVLGFGYIIALGPVGLFSNMWSNAFGAVPWNIYTPGFIALAAGMSAVPYVYLYISTALRNVSSDMEEAARVCGGNPIRIFRQVSLPLVRPALTYCSIFVFFMGIETFGLVLMLGSASNIDVLSVYIYKLTNRYGLPSYNLMAAVVVLLLLITIPLVVIQRKLLSDASRYVSVRGKATRQVRVSLGAWRWPAFFAVATFLIFTLVIPVTGITLRAFVSSWGKGVYLLDSLTLAHMQTLLSQPTLYRGIRNSILMGIVGGFLAVSAYMLVALSVHRKASGTTRTIDFVSMLPRATPGLAIGLAFLWVFLFIPYLSALKSTLFSVWIAYVVVWFAYGLRLLSTALYQLGPELEEAARTCGATPARSTMDVILPLSRTAFISSWLLVFLMFVREYSTGVYLMSAGTEMIGPLMISLVETGAMEQVAALAFVNLAVIGVGLILALRFGAKVNA